MLRGLSHYWRLHLSVAAAVAVCTAVLTGALLVGDSVRGSLRDLTLDRLGRIELALVADRFFPEDLAERLRATPDTAEPRAVEPVVLLRGSLEHAGSGARASGVGVLGVGPDFLDLWRDSPVSPTFAAGSGPPPEELLLQRPAGQVFTSVVLNHAVSRELGAVIGDQVLIRFQLGSAIPRDTLLGERDAGEVLGTLRATVSQIIPDRGAGRFDLNAHQTFPLNAFVDRAALQAALEQPGRVNSLLVSSGERTVTDLDSVLTLEDLGLTVRTLSGTTDATVVEITSDEYVLRPHAVAAIDAVADELGARRLTLQSYLANTLRVGDRTVPYSMVLAVDPPPATDGFGVIESRDGSVAGPLADDQVLLSRWAADELQAPSGARLLLDYYVVGADERLRTESRTLTVAGIASMTGLAIDGDLAPDYPGIAGIENMADWDPPFPVDLSLVRPQDEAYWDVYGPAPKAFVSAALGRELWATRYGALTSVRLVIPDDEGGSAGALATETRVATALRSHLVGSDFGLRFLAVRNEGLEAAAGATDFGGLFIGFSFFLIVSSVLIVGLLFGLGVDRRAAEVGLLQAMGYRRKTVRNRLLAEGLVVALAGSTFGLLGAILYGRLLILGLTTLWLPAVGSPLLYLYVGPSALGPGWILSVLVAVGAMLWSLRALRSVGAIALLKGTFRSSVGQRRRRARWRGRLAVGATILAVLLLSWGLASGSAADPAIAFGSGSALLVAGVAGFSAWCREGRGRLGRPGGFAAAAMARRNTGWSPGRSVLSVGLVASACFVLVAVAGNTRNPASEVQTVREGAGGFDLVATTDVPLYTSLDSAEGRFDLGMSDAASSLLEGAEIQSLRLLPGDDASCLNLYRPTRPRLLGIPATFRARGGFHFGANLGAELGFERPWDLLTAALGPGVIPAIGDANSTQWILHLGLGDEIEIEDERGNPLRVRIVGMLRESIFQSELLISEENLRSYFPGRSGYSYFLIDAPDERTSDLATALEEGLGRFGLDAVSSAQKLAGFLVVQNTYLSTFQMLGGLGLLLGTVGLGIILVRNVIERRGELATLRAFGFGRRFLSLMVLAENAFLLAVGTIIGSGAALAAISPRYLLGAVEVPWESLGLTLGAVLLVGMLASSAAVALALRTPLLPALKSDR